MSDERAATPSSAVPSKDVSILVVDDEKLIRWSVGERLSRRGYAVSTASSGEEALDLIAAQPPTILLLDVRLPGINGLETFQRALALCPELTVLMMSAHGSVDVAVEALRRGAVDFLVKPFPFEALDAAIARALGAAELRAQVAALTAERRGGEHPVDRITGRSAAMERVRQLVARLAASPATTVLITGPSGVGKGVVARAVHFESARADRPLMEVNCAALPEQLLESELFGHERGAFTDARTLKHGLVETARGGSVFLDEIAELAAGAQAKLLRLLENRTFRRLGGLQEMAADVRVIAATNADLEARVQDGRFRADLFFRLSVVPIRVPSLREHAEDIPDLVAQFLARLNQEMGSAIRGVAPEAMDLLLAYAWPGNVRELRNVLERAVILDPHAREVRPEHLPPELQHIEPTTAAAGGTTPALSLPLDGAADQDALAYVERQLLSQAMDKARGNQSHAARLLGISRDTLRYRMRKHGLLK